MPRLVRATGAAAAVFATVALAILLARALRPAEPPAPPDLTYRRVQETGVLRVGTDATNPPFEMYADGTFTGFDVDLMRLVAARLGVQVEFVNIPVDGLYEALTARRIDAAASALTPIYELTRDFLYSPPYFVGGQVLVVPGRTRIAGPADLGGLRLGVELGSNADLAARQLVRQDPTVQLQSTFRTPEAALAALERGTVDAAVVDKLVARAYLRSGGEGLKLVEPPLLPEAYALAARSESYDLMGAMRAALTDLRTSGELDALVEEWL